MASTWTNGFGGGTPLPPDHAELRLGQVQPLHLAALRVTDRVHVPRVPAPPRAVGMVGADDPRVELSPPEDFHLGPDGDGGQDLALLVGEDFPALRRFEPFVSHEVRFFVFLVQINEYVVEAGAPGFVDVNHGQSFRDASFVLV